jgi:hypothetical protein
MAKLGLQMTLLNKVGRQITPFMEKAVDGIPSIETLVNMRMPPHYT